MIDRSLAIHGTLAAVAALAAYVAWVKPRFAGDDATVEIIAGSAAALEEIIWQDKTQEIRVKRAGDDVQVMITNTPPKADTSPPAAAPDVAKEQGAKAGAAKVEADKAGAAKVEADKAGAAKAAVATGAQKPGMAAVAAPAAAPSASPKAAPPAPAAKVFPASTIARELFDKLAPFSGLRSLGQVDADHLKDFGLAPAEATLRLRFKKGEHTVKVGSVTFGFGQQYVQIASGEVYLVKASLLADLKSGGNLLPERSLLPIVRTKIEKVALAGGGKSRELVQRFREDPTKAFWADPAEPDGKLTQAGNWMDRLLRARISDLATKKPDGAPALTAELSGDGRQLGTVSLWLPADGDALATSTIFKSPVTLPKWMADALVKDLESVLTEKPQ